MTLPALHPSRDARLQSRHATYNPKNQANDALFLAKVAEAIDNGDEALREFVHNSFLTGELEWLLHDGQLKIASVINRDDVNEALIFCSRQLGKSFFTLIYAIQHCTRLWKGKKPLVRIFCETEKQINDIVSDNMQLIQQLAPPGFIEQRVSDKRWRVGQGEIRLGILSGAHSHGSRGGNATLIITEECSFSPSDTFKLAVQSVLSPQLLRSQGKLIHVTTPSDDENHYIHTTVLPKCELSDSFINLTIYDNPQLSDEQIIKAFEFIYDGSTEQWEREYLAKIVRSVSLAVIPEMPDDNLVNPDIVVPTHAYWLNAIDFGGVRDKHGMLLTYWDFERAKLVIWNEALLPINTSTDEIKNAALELEKDAKFIDGFPLRITDAPGQVLVDLRNDGFNVRFPDKEAGSFEANINAIRLAVQRREIEIHPRCKLLIATLRHAKFNKQRTDFLRTEQLGHMDLLAALMYAWKHKRTANPFPSALPSSNRYAEPAEPSPITQLFFGN